MLMLNVISYNQCWLVSHMVSKGKIGGKSSRLSLQDARCAVV